MKLKTNITEEREIDIQLPIFRKVINSTASVEYLAVIEESHVISIYDNQDSKHTRISVTPMWLSTGDVLTALNKWQEIDEYEFLLEEAKPEERQAITL